MQSAEKQNVWFPMKKRTKCMLFWDFWTSGGLEWIEHLPARNHNNRTIDYSVASAGGFLKAVFTESNVTSEPKGL